MTRPTNRDVGALVAARREFQTGNKTIYAQWITDQSDPEFYRAIYVVFSYGQHFPMYIWDDATMQWYANKDKYSSTTSRHQTHARPPHVDQWFDTEGMQSIVRGIGLPGAVCDILKVAA